MDLDNYSLKDLKHLKKQIDKAIDTFEERALENARLELEKHAKSLGYTLEQLTQAKPTKQTRQKTKKVAAKYRDPNDGSQTWTGRGRKPAWVVDQLNSGRTLEDLLI